MSVKLEIYCSVINANARIIGSVYSVKDSTGFQIYDRSRCNKEDLCGKKKDCEHLKREFDRLAGVLREEYGVDKSLC